MKSRDIAKLGGDAMKLERISRGLTALATRAGEGALQVVAADIEILRGRLLDIRHKAYIATL